MSRFLVGCNPRFKRAVMSSYEAHLELNDVDCELCLCEIHKKFTF